MSTHQLEFDMIEMILKHLCIASDKRTLANTVDPDQTSDQGVHCLQIGQDFL